MSLLNNSGVLSAVSLVAGYSVARATGVRPLGGAVLAAGGVLAGRRWLGVGVPTTVALSALYLGAFGASHPLAKKIGAWPSVFAVAGVTGVVSHLVADRRLS